MDITIFWIPSFSLAQQSPAIMMNFNWLSNTRTGLPFRFIIPRGKFWNFWKYRKEVSFTPLTFLNVYVHVIFFPKTYWIKFSSLQKCTGENLGFMIFNSMQIWNKNISIGFRNSSIWIEKLCENNAPDFLSNKFLDLRKVLWNRMS